jgi:hypothetical protein
MDYTMAIDKVERFNFEIRKIAPSLTRRYGGGKIPKLAPIV